MSWRMDRNKSWLGGRLFNMAPPRLAAPTQCKARPQDGRPNTTQGLSTSWAPQRNTRNVHKLRAPTYVCNVNARHICNARHIRKLGAPTHFRNANARHVRTSAISAPQRNERRVRKMGAQMQCKARSQDGRPNEKPIRNKNIHKGALG